MDVSINISATVLETERLLLRPWRLDDLEDFNAYASVPGVGEMAGWRHHDSLATSRAILSTFIGKEVFALEEKATGRVIGSFGIHISWANDHPIYGELRQKEIGFALAKSHWGQGLMPEAVQAVIRFAFHYLRLEALTVGHFVDNQQSKRVIEKSGFTFVRTDNIHAPQLQQYFAIDRYILLNESK